MRISKSVYESFVSGEPLYGADKGPCPGCHSNGLQTCSTPCEGFTGLTTHRSRGLYVCGPRCRAHGGVRTGPEHFSRAEIKGSIAVQMAMPLDEPEYQQGPDLSGLMKGWQ